MKESTKALAISALRSARSDDYERAKRAFAGYTPEQMSKEYGQSGNTCADILEGYRQHVEGIDAAIKDLEASA